MGARRRPDNATALAPEVLRSAGSLGERRHAVPEGSMRELHSIVEAFEQARASGKRAALATVVSVRGSAYRRPGARMLITQDGQTTGTISGGCLERDVILRAQPVIERGEPTLAPYDSTHQRPVHFR